MQGYRDDIHTSTLIVRKIAKQKMGENILEDDEEKKECRPGKPAMFVKWL